MAKPASTRVASWLICKATIILSSGVYYRAVVYLMRYLGILNRGLSLYFSILVSCSHEPYVFTFTHFQAPEAVDNVAWPIIRRAYLVQTTKPSERSIQATGPDD